MKKVSFKMNNTSKAILEYLSNHPVSSSKSIHEGVDIDVGYATIKRGLTGLLHANYIEKKGNGKSTKYIISPSYAVIRQIDMDDYFKLEIDEREIKQQFNLELIPNILSEVQLFSTEELSHLAALQGTFEKNIQTLSKAEYQNEMERLAIDLSWKSSQIEGNTYSLLETERLLKEKLTADGKNRDEATMLLNHKVAIDFIVTHPDYLSPVTVHKIEDIHSILTRDLDINRNIRNRRVGISGTNYQPLDNEYQIREALQHMCNLVNSKTNVFEKTLLLLVLLSYIQAFSDGNKRTARIVSNACLMNHKYCPISFRTVDSIDYKKAMLIFYEQNNISAFKHIFISQFEFAVKTYF